MSDIVELFKMILKRNELVKTSFNAYQRYTYTFKRYLKGYHQDIELLTNRAIELKIAKEKVKAFTKVNTTRRRKLAYQLKTKQYKNAVNKIEWISIDNKRYSLLDMKRIIEEHKIEQILLGEG